MRISRLNLRSLYLGILALCMVLGKAQAQIINTIAGTGVAGYNGDGIQATNAKLYYPSGITKDAADNLIICDDFNGRVRKVNTLTGVITTIAGTGGLAYTGDGGPATDATFGGPLSVAIDGANNIYVADMENEVIRKIDASGIITTFAGTGTVGYTGDGGPATNAELGHPWGVATDNYGNLFIADQGNFVVRKVDISGTITTVAGNGVYGFSGDGGPATAAQMYHPGSLCFDDAGNMYITDNGNNRIRKVIASGGSISSSNTIVTFAGNGAGSFSGDGGNATLASINYPQVVTSDHLGNIYIGDNGNYRIRKVNTSGVISTITGNGISGFSGDNGPAIYAEFAGTFGLTTDCSGNVYFSDTYNNRVRIIKSGGITVPASSSVCVGSAITLTTLLTGGIWSSGNPSIATIGAGTGVLTGISAGAVTITYTYPTGCYVTTSIAVNPLPSPISGPNVVCAGSSIALTDATGTGTWNNTLPGDASINLISGVLAGYSDGVPTVFYTLPTGCRVSKLITVNPLPAAIAGSTGICLGATSIFSNASPGGAWNSSASSIANITSASGVATGVAIGTATITYTLPTGCSASIPVTVNTPTPITGITTVCIGLTTGLSNGTMGGFWSSSSPGVAIVDAASGIVTGISVGSTVITYALFSGCTVTTTLSVTSPPAITGILNVCPHTSVTLSDASSGGTWSSANITIATVTPGSGVVTGLTAGASTGITYTLPSGCYVAATVTVAALPAISGLSQVCVGLTTTLTPSTIGGTWTSSRPGTATVDGGGVVTGVAAGVVVISYTSPPFGCIATFTITVNPLPAAITGTNIFCPGNAFAFADATTGGTWSSSNTAVSTVSASGLVTAVASGTATITYTAASGCIATRPMTVNIVPATITGALNVCAGSTTVLSDITSGGTWRSSDLTIATVNASGVVTGVAAGTVTINYSIGSGCDAVMVITVNPLPAAIAGAAILCPGNMFMLIDASGGGTWSSLNPAIATISSASGAVTTVTGGLDTIVYTLPTGCSIITAVSVNPAPTPIFGTPYYCTGIGTLLHDSFYGGTWTSSDVSIATIGAYTGFVTEVAPGTATITYTTPAGCFVTATVAPLPAITGLHDMCAWEQTMSLTASDAAITGGLYTSSRVTVANIGTGIGLVTSHGPGISTVTYTIPSGCSVTTTFTTNPLPDIIEGPLLNVCSGGSLTLTDGIAGGVWTSEYPGIATVGYFTGVVTGVATGPTLITYTLATTGCYTDTAVYVNPSPAPIIGGGITLCAGTTTTVRDVVAGGVWSSSNPAIATVSAAGVVNGLTAGTTTISYSICGGVTTVTITVYTVPPITGPAYVCLGVPTTFTDATPGGTWAISDHSSATVGTSSGAFTGLVNGRIVTLYYTLGSGCGSAVNVRVTDITDCNSPCANLPLGYTELDAVTGDIGHGDYYMPYSVTVATNVNISRANILMAPGTTLSIDGSHSMNIDNSHLFGGCQMWNGIVLQNNPGVSSGRLSIVNNSLIEDALTAVYVNYPVTPDAGLYILKTDGAIFNRNITAIDIENYYPRVASYPFLIRNTVVTSRDFKTALPAYPYNWPQSTGAVASGGLKAPWATTDVFTPPFNINNPSAIGSVGYNGIGCKNGGYSNTGIKLVNVGANTLSTILTSTYHINIPASYNEIVIGDGTATTGNQYQNMFDNIQFGINATNSNLSSVNNAFTNLWGTASSSYPYGTIASGGDGIYAVTTDDNNNENRLRVYTPAGSTYRNLFYGFRNGVECSNYFEVIGQHNYMINRSPGTGKAGSLVPVGQFGYTIKTAKYDQIDISSDSILNVVTGVSLWMNTDPVNIVHTVSQFTGSGNISNNVIQPHPNGYGAIAGQSVTNAISVQNMLATTGITRTSGALNVNGNSLNDVYNGIFINGMQQQLAYTENNIIVVRPNGTSPRWLQYGINTTNCYKNTVYFNSVTGSMVGTAPVAGVSGDSMRAFYSVTNSTMNMGCNNESGLGRGFEFFMACPLTNWHNNTMLQNRKGMILNGATIGTQNNASGTLNRATGNQWAGTWGSGDTQTFVYNRAVASSSPMYVTNTSLFNPTINSGDPRAPLRDYFSSPSSSIMIASASPSSCTPPPPAPASAMVNDSGNIMVQIAQQQVAYTDNIIPNNWMGQYALWNAILADSTLIDSSATFAVFSGLAANSRYAYITTMETALANGDFTTVSDMLGYNIDSMANTSWDTVTQVQMADGTGADNIVENYQNFISLYMKYVDSNLTGSDTLAIMALAQLCPQRNGAVVFQARALYSSLFNDLSMFNDDSCMDIDSTYIAARHSSGHQTASGQVQNQTVNGQQYILHPNPSNGNVTLHQLVIDNEPVRAQIWNASGANIYKDNLQFVGGVDQLHLINAMPGLYLLQLTDSKGKSFNLKFVVQ